MRYEDFVAGQTEAWERFASRLDQLEKAPSAISHEALEELSVDYRKVLHDQAVAASRFDGTWAVAHLRRLSVRANRLLQPQETSKLASPLRFFSRTFPQNFQAIGGEIAVCLALFAVSTVFGAALSALDTEVGTAFVGQNSVDGLGRGEIWTDSLNESPATGSAQIAVNNMRVAITAWGGGALAGFGAFYVLFLNGFLLGAVMILTSHFDMDGALLQFISAHGPLELSIIVIAAAAGVHVGRELVSPGNRPLSARLPKAARRSAVVMLGCLPWLLVLGFVEGFISPSPGIAHGTKVALGLVLLSLFLCSALLPTLGARPRG
ncbi:MAG: stage II sporulation protein M [Acidobacteriota bacterium]